MQLTDCMYYGSKRKLPHTDIKIFNKASIPMKLIWQEIDIRGKRHKIEKNIAPNETIFVKLGELGGYNREGGTSKVIYNPIPGNETFKQDFNIALPTSNTWILTAAKLADVLNNIWIPGVIKSDD